MKVLYFINAGIMGGRERHVCTLVKALPKEIEYLVCSVSVGESTNAMIEKKCNIKVLNCRNGHDIRLFWRFYKVIHDFKPDVIHAHSEALFPFWVLKMFKHIPIVYSIHGPSTNMAECVERKKSLWFFLKSKIEKFLKRKPDYFLPVSKATWEDFLLLNPKAKGEVFFNALDFSLLPKQEKTQNDFPIVGMVGRMADEKDWGSFLEIAAELIRRKPNLSIWAIGDGPLKKEMQDYWTYLVEKNNIDGSLLTWFGSRQDARDLILKMDVFLLTSKHEQLPTTVLEAMALRTPVVGFLPVGGTKEILDLSPKKIALLNEERSVLKVVDDTLHVLKDKSLRNSLIDEAFNVVHHHFDMNQLCATQLITIYNRLMKGNR